MIDRAVRTPGVEVSARGRECARRRNGLRAAHRAARLYRRGSSDGWLWLRVFCGESAATAVDVPALLATAATVLPPSRSFWPSLRWNNSHVQR